MTWDKKKPKTNMETQNGDLEDEFLFQRDDFGAPCLFSREERSNSTDHPISSLSPQRIETKNDATIYFDIKKSVGLV